MQDMQTTQDEFESLGIFKPFQPKNVLIVSDTWFSSGFQAVYYALLQHKDYQGANIFAVIPDKHYPAASFSHNSNTQLTLTHQKSSYFPNLYYCSGTPVDCLHLGIQLMKSHGYETDLVISVSTSHVLGRFWYYNGAACAAKEATHLGLRAIVVAMFEADARAPRPVEAKDLLFYSITEVVNPFILRYYESDVLCYNIPDTMSVFEQSKAPELTYALPSISSRSVEVTRSVNTQVTYVTTHNKVPEMLEFVGELSPGLDDIPIPYDIQVINEGKIAMTVLK